MWGRIYPHLVLLIFVNIILKTSCQGNGSITFLIDDTSSMDDDIRQVRKSVHRIKEIVLHEKSSLIDNMVLVTLNDPGVHERIVTKDPNEFKSALDKIRVHNEAKRPYLDCWEPAMKGLLLALEKSKNNSYIFVFTDAPAKDYIDSQSVIELCQQKQTQIIFVLTGTLCSKFTYVPAAIDSYFDIATACSGLAIFVKKNEVDKVFGPIEEIIKGNKTMITTVTIPADVSKIIPFTVDSYTDYVIIYSYGKNVSLKVNEPRIPSKAIMWTENAKVLKLTNIKPGTYHATVKGSSRTTISVAGRTNFIFNHGFSESKPKSPSDTSPQPMDDDTKVYLSISVNDDQQSVKMESAQFLDMNEKPIGNKMSLTEVSKNFYVTDQFIAPSQMFKVAVSGIVLATGQAITRISKIPVTPAPPKIPPKVQGVTTMKVNKGETAQIECKVVRGFPAPNISWLFEDQSSSTFTPMPEASDSVLVITNVEHKHDGKYKCIAENVKGKDEHVTTLHVQEAPQVTGVAAKKVRIGSPTSIECTVVKGEPKPTLTWQFMNVSSTKFVSITGSDKELPISRVESKHAGRYKCVAQNSVGSDEHVTTLEVQDLPKIVPSPSNIYQSIEGDALLRIPCAAAGLPKPNIMWLVNGRVINPSEKFSIEDGTLIIRSPKVSDTNSYTCEAKNEVGADRATFKAYIRQVPILKGVHTVKARIGAATKIECTVNGEPKPTIKWQFMDKSSSTFLSVSGSDEVLHISMVASKHAGRYKCIAQNNVGTNEHVTTLEVQDPPRISSATTIFESTEGDALLKIPCYAEGLPVPSITWKAEDLVIKPSAKYTIEDGTLVIRNPKKSDTNSYTCEAKNEAGAVSATFKAYIRQIPKLKGEDSKNVKIGTPVKIECIIDQGEPTPKISWQFMDKNALKFVPITGSENVFHISNAENKHAGSYKCVAQNSVGSDEHVTTLTVEYLREITINSTTVEGILGDLALRIPCKVDGVPPPVITWKKNGNKITLNEKYSIEDGALVIVKPAASDSSSYTCEAMNSMGSTSATFQATVRRLPKNFGTEHYVYLKEGENKKLECEAYTSESQSVKWFATKYVERYESTSSSPDSTETTTVLSTTEASSMKRQTTELNNTEPYIQVASASSWEHDGNYTCHVSDKHGNTQTHTYVVDVGMPPKFKIEDNALNYWRGDTADIVQYCDIEENAKPTPVVKWSLNGKALTDLNSVGVGHYTCNVSNVHGYVLKQFDVKSSACIISRNLQNMPYTPLVLNDEGFWHKLETKEYNTIIEPKMKIILSCPSLNETPNSFKTFPKKSTLDAICYEEDFFIVDDKTYKFSDLQCTDSIQPSVIKTKVKCSTETSELIRVGYNVPGFLEAYEVCFDHKSNMPSYTRSLMTDTNNGLNGVHNWYTHPGIGSKQTERGFTCKDASSSCCYSKSQLVNAVDFNDGPAKKSTFLDPLNVIPAWMPCDSSKLSWKDINDKVRTQLPTYIDIAVWSGTHTLQEKNGAAIPRYLWKVVRLTDDDVMAIVHVNDPNPTKSDIKCKKSIACDNHEEWVKSDDSTYCCSLPDFMKSFDIHSTDIGETMETVLNKMKS